jgi:hypothetical protein
MARKKKYKAAENQAEDSKEGKQKYADNPHGYAERWSSEFGQAKEFHRKWREAGKNAVSQYLSRDMKTSDPQAPGYNLNLFAANINTLMSMLYGKVPQVSADRRWADPDDTVSRIASEMATRCLNADIEAAGYDFSAILRGTLQDRLLPGLGCARIRYSCDIGEEDDQEGETTSAEEKPESKKDEWIDDEYVPWQDVLWSPCRYWAEMRWIAFKLYKTKEEVIEFLGDAENAKEIADELDYNSKAPLENATQKTSENWDKCEIWEIWDKIKKKVYWWVEGYHRTIKDVDDPLELEGFYPCPPFLIANTTTMEYVPKSDYSFAASLYREVDRLEERIALLTMAIKVVGVYDKKAGQDIGRLVNETAENKLIPVDAWAAFAERGGIKGSIEFMPIDQIAQVIEILQDQQQKRIDQLFQITGMSDILRGQASGDKPASATEQQIKVKFASVRIQSLQDEFTRFATDLQKLRFELMCKHFDVETIIRNSNMMNTADGRDTPELVMQAAQFLKEQPKQALWRIEIQPESMAMVDYAQLKQERTEYINGLGIFLQSSFPVAEKFPEAAPILMELLKWGLAGFKGSKEIEGVMDRAISAMQQQAKNPQPKPPDPQLQKVQMEMQQDQQNHQAKLEQMQVEFAQKQKEQNDKHQLDMQSAIMDFKAKIAEIRAEMTKTHHETQAHVTKAQADQQTATVQGHADQQTAQAKAITAAAEAQQAKQAAAAEAQPLNMGSEEQQGGA